MTPELIADYACHIGENPLWHPLEHRLYWTDIPTGRLFQFDPGTGEHRQIFAGRPVGGFTFQADGGLLLFMDRGTIGSWRNGELTDLLSSLPQERHSRFNDVYADRTGRVFCGTMSTDQQPGRLYRLDTDGHLHLVLEGIGCSNGIAISEDQKDFYYTDSFARQIYRFDYDDITGNLENKEVFATFREDGLPDGITLDTEGRLWVALWGGGCIVRLSEQGSIVEKYELPVAKVASLTFAGEDLDDLYVSTAGGDDKTANGSLAGAVFRFRTSSRGLPENVSRVSGAPITFLPEEVRSR